MYEIWLQMFQHINIDTPSYVGQYPTVLSCYTYHIFLLQFSPTKPHPYITIYLNTYAYTYVGCVHKGEFTLTICCELTFVNTFDVYTYIYI